MKTNRWSMFILSGWLLLVMLLTGMLAGCSNNAASEGDYKAFFKQQISARLRDPASASYSWSNCETSSDGTRFRGVCHIRCTNAFGGYVTENFTVTGKVENGRIHIEWY